MIHYADLVSTAAFALSSVLATREILLARRAAPHIIVRSHFEGQPGKSGPEIRAGIQVSNNGRTAVTVSAIGFELRLERELKNVNGVTATVGQGHQFDPPMPYRLEGHDDVKWLWPAEFTTVLRERTAFRPFVDTYGWAPARRLRRRRSPSGNHRHYVGQAEWLDPHLLDSVAGAVESRRDFG